jgi:GNAT superfamily N-acetyltransferase
MTCTLRLAEPKDAASVLGLIQGLADYEKESDAVVATAETIADDLDGGSAVQITCLLAEVDDAVVGMALFFHSYSTWRGKPGLYLEDLYVQPESREQGIGMLLMEELARIARSRDCARFEWSCLDWNEPSIKFYEALGAKQMVGWSTFRLEGEALDQLGRKGADL